MSFTPIYIGNVSKGKLILQDKERFQMWIEGLDGVVEIIVRKHRNNRTNRQNNLYWGYLELIEAETGNTANDLHEYLKRKFLQPREITVLGEKIRLPATTTKLNTKQFSEYLEKICALTGVPIPTNIDI